MKNSNSNRTRNNRECFNPSNQLVFYSIPRDGMGMGWVLLDPVIWVINGYFLENIIINVLMNQIYLFY